MFPYQDPTGTDFLVRHQALEAYRSKLQNRYAIASREAGTHFVSAERMTALQNNLQPTLATIPWNAFPRLKSNAGAKTIDDRISGNLQEEYVEWDVQFRPDGIDQLTFTTEFPEYFEALADVSFDALVTAVKELIPGAEPTAQELLGLDSPPPSLIVDGLVGSATWSVLNRVTHLEEDPNQQPFLRRGTQGQAVVRLQERLAALDLLSLIDGDFGPATETAVKKAQASYVGGGKFFRDQLNQNPWNNGRKGILCLAQTFNTLPFLFELVSQCSVPKRHVRPQEVCGLSEVECVPNRSSDPNVCAAAQNQVLRDRVTSLKDPVGIRIIELQGIWERNGKRIEINDPGRNEGIWTVSRNGRRGVLRNLPGLTLDGSVIETGAQVAHKLQVGADVFIAPASALS